VAGTAAKGRQALPGPQNILVDQRSVLPWAATWRPRFVLMW
jgi:hypothetical protein